MGSMRLLGALVALALTGQPVMSQSGAAPPDNPQGAAPSLKVETVEALIAEYQAAMEKFYDGFAALSTDEERAAYVESSSPDPGPFVKRAWAFADSAPGTEAALKAIVWAMNVTRDAESLSRGIKLLGADFMNSEGLVDIVDTIAGTPTPESDAFLRRVLAETPHRTVRAMTTYALSTELGARASLRATLASATKEDLVMYRDWLSPAALTFIREGDTAKLAAEREELLKQLIDKYGDVEKYGMTLSELASGDLFELQNLQVGMVAPEIEDVNLDGEPMKLSDFRGKVVMLDFWGDW